MRKLFVTREDDSLFSIADIFGYVIAFFILWLLILGYRAVSRVTHKASSIASTQFESVKESLPKTIEAMETKPTTTTDLQTVEEDAVPTSSLIPQILPDISNKALDLVSTTSNKASKMLTKEGAKDTLSSINSYLNNLIFSVADEAKDLNVPTTNRSSKEDEDELSSF